MQTTLNIDRLRDLLANLHEITHLQFSLHDVDGREIYSIYSRSAFCDLMCSTEEGYRRCVDCDARAIGRFAPTLKPFQYRCHAGLIDMAIPVTEHGQLVVIILFGQILDDSPLDAQWAHAQRQCAWHPDPEALREAFWALPQLTGRQIQACLAIINACVSEMRLEGLLKTGEQTDAQRLENYIHTYYATPLTLTAIAQALSISKSKLCQLAAQVEPGMTVTGLINRRRIAVAMRLLEKPDAAIRDVAEAVGIPDYNYFARVFKRIAGMTPSAYRRAQDE